MKEIILWGTGKQAKNFMKNYYNILQNKYLLRGFIDNNINNQGKFFYGYKVFPPKELKRINTDILVVMNKKYNEIVVQIDKIFSERKPFLLLKSQREFFNYIVNQEKIFIDKKIIFTGDYDGYATLAERDQHITASSRFVELNCVKKLNLKSIDYFCVCGKRFSDSVFNAIFQENIKKILHMKHSISLNKILFEDQWRWYFDSDVLVRNNASNEKDRYLVIRVNDPYRGWGQILLNFMAAIDYAEKNNLHPAIDMQYSENMYLLKEDKGKYNVWNDFFYPVSNGEIKDILSKRCCFIYGSDCYIPEQYMQFSKINFLPDVLKKLNQSKSELFTNSKKILAVVYRGSDYETAADHPSPMSIEGYINRIDMLIINYRFDTIFLATEIIEVVEAFKKIYGSKLRYSSQKRVRISERNYLKNIFSVGDRETVYKNSIDYLSIIYILSQCDAICGSRCGASQLAVVMNNYKYLFIDYFS